MDSTDSMLSLKENFYLRFRKCAEKKSFKATGDR